jgi:hypothetical protein
MTQTDVTNNETVTGSKHFFRLFPLLLKGMQTNLWGTFALVPISAHPTVVYIR